MDQPRTCRVRAKAGYGHALYRERLLLFEEMIILKPAFQLRGQAEWNHHSVLINDSLLTPSQPESRQYRFRTLIGVVRLYEGFCFCLALSNFDLKRKYLASAGLLERRATFYDMLEGLAARMEYRR